MFLRRGLVLWTLIAIGLMGSTTVKAQFEALSACNQIQTSISSSSNVYWPGTLSYAKDISHWASSSTQASVCSVEPGTTEDVGKILQIIGSTRAPFAIKGGGHTANGGFSSTSGVTIAMYRFSEVTFRPETNDVVVGSGLVWDDVYAALEPEGVTVVGGRFTGVGVAGYSLGGGYSWHSNQYGLTVDNILGFELVLPNGTLTDVTQSSNPDLFFALKGGFNNYGVVTRFRFKTIPITQVWGGLATYVFGDLDKINAAITKFSNTVNDPKAAIFSAYNAGLGVVPVVLQYMFYDGPEPPSGIFDDFLAIPTVLPKEVKTRTFTDLVKSTVTNITTGFRGVFDTVPITQYTASMVDAIANETFFWGNRLTLAGPVSLSWGIEPFLPSSLHPPNTTDPGTAQPSSAFPAVRPQNKPLQPTILYYSWALSTSDQIFIDAAKESVRVIKDKAKSEGVWGGEGSSYPNYAIYDTLLEEMYGAENLVRMRKIKAGVDPGGVMGLAGGFKV